MLMGLPGPATLLGLDTWHFTLKILQPELILHVIFVDNNHHVAGKYMCVGFLCQGFLRRNKKQAIGVLVYMQAYIRTV